MVIINLLKNQRQSERQARRRPTSELFVGAFVLAIIFVGWGWVAVDGSQAIQRLEQEIQDKQARLALMAQRQDLVLTRQEQRNAIVTEHDTLEALTQDLERPTRLLSVISRVVGPLDVWLRQLQANEEKVTLSGVALSHESILKLAKDLENADMLGPVDVFEIQVHVAQPELFRFSMNVFMDSVDHG